MSITVYNPFQELANLENTFKNSSFRSGFYKPETDLYETADEFIVEINLPGVKREDISIDSTSDTLEIKVETVKEEKDSENTNELESDKDKWIVRHIERISRNYARKIQFNKSVNPKEAKITLENGVLRIILPISAEAKKISLEIE